MSPLLLTKPPKEFKENTLSSEYPAIFGSTRDALLADPPPFRLPPRKCLTLHLKALPGFASLAHVHLPTSLCTRKRPAERRARPGTPRHTPIQVYLQFLRHHQGALGGFRRRCRLLVTDRSGEVDFEVCVDDADPPPPGWASMTRRSKTIEL